MKKNLFLTFCFSFIPGAGQMYQGCMKRGLSLMLVFGIFVAIAAIIGAAVFMIPLPIIFAYSFFDTYNIREKKGTENEVLDEYVWNDFLDQKLFVNLKTKKINNIFGIVLIVIGIYILLDSVIYNLAHRLELYYISNIIKTFMRYFSSALVAILSIYFGAKILSKKR